MSKRIPGWLARDRTARSLENESIETESQRQGWPNAMAIALLFLVCPASVVAQSTAPATQPACSRLGVNIPTVRDWTPMFMFIDVMKSSRRFASPQRPWEGEVPLDEHGWPTADAGVIAFSEAVNVNGVYRLSLTGRATVEVVRSPAAVRNRAYDEAANRTTAEIVFDAPPDEVTRLFLAFADTTGGVRDIKLLRPGYADDSAIFTDEFLRAIEPFGCLRFMDYLKTNDSKIVTWSQRVKPTDAQFTVRGGPYEYAIELGNRAGKDVWLNVPAAADDEFVRQLATLVKNKLAPGVNCYVEWSNELWNTIFSQHQLNLDAAREETARGDRTLNLGGRDANPRHWAWRRTARRTVEIARIFRDVCGPDDRRVRVVLAGQHANPQILETGLRYIEANHGPPREFLYGVAIAPYFGNDDKAALKRPDLSVDDVTAMLRAQANESADARAEASHDLARRYGLKSLAYEGGIDLGQYDVAVEAKARAQLDPRTGDAVEKHLRAWFAHGGDEYVYFTLVSRYTKSGYWGLTDDVRRLDVPKMQAAKRVADTVPQPAR